MALSKVYQACTEYQSPMACISTKRMGMILCMGGAAILLSSCAKNRLETEILADHAAMQELGLETERLPKVANAKKVTFGAQVLELVGYKLGATSAVPGKTVKVTFYWHLLQGLPRGWNLATRVYQNDSEEILNADNVGQLRTKRGSRQTLPPGEWEVGKFYIDEQTIAIPRDVSGAVVTVRVGVIRGDKSLPPENNPQNLYGLAWVFELPVAGATVEPE